LAILYVNDTGLLHINFNKDETVDDAHIAIQNSVDSWGNLLIATGGALKPQKYFYSILSFEWICGEWKYKGNSINGRYGVTVPLPGGGFTAIVHCPVTHAEKTLGALTSPDGSSPGTIYYKCRRRCNNGWTQLGTVTSTVGMSGYCWGCSSAMGRIQPVQLNGYLRGFGERTAETVFTNSAVGRDHQNSTTRLQGG
jgi:hypothetical protein